MHADAIEALKAALEDEDWNAALPPLRAMAVAESERPLNWANLAAVTRHAGLDPRPPLRRAVLLQPEDPSYLNDLGAEEAEGQGTAARLLVLDPLHVPATIMRALHFLGVGDVERATRLLTRACLADPADAEAAFLHAQALERQEAAGEAIRLFRAVRILDPADGQGAGRHLAKLGAGPVDAAFSRAYVRRLFDEYAENFDAHLTGRLKYAAPEMLKQLALSCGAVSMETKRRSMVDIGCGTGLAGAVFRPFCNRLTGIDIAGEMVRLAAEKELYDRLLTGDASDFLEQTDESYALAIAADVSSYIPDLAQLFSAVARRLDPDGFFLLTAHAPGPDDKAEIGIGRDGACYHSLAYLERIAAAAGLELAAMQEGAMREEAGAPLSTRFLAFTKLRQSGV